ncbi:MAG TPA: hypothetical protein VNM91_07555 [Dehalococcoidia bacterium]|nr:hypothetical protein [Dehalococcoidia bacterium]
MTLPMDPSFLFVATFRDWVIIIMGISVAAFFIVGLVMMIVLGLVLRALLRKVSDVMDEGVRPLLGSAKETAQTVKGTSTYVSQAAVQPIIKTYGVVAGVRRAASVIAGITSASTDNAKGRDRE